jgi:hypothetical protein
MFVTGPAGAGKCKQQYYSVPLVTIFPMMLTNPFSSAKLLERFLLMQNSSVKISAILSAGRQFVLQQ